MAHPRRTSTMRERPPSMMNAASSEPDRTPLRELGVVREGPKSKARNLFGVGRPKGPKEPLASTWDDPVGRTTEAYSGGVRRSATLPYTAGDDAMLLGFFASHVPEVAEYPADNNWPTDPAQSLATLDVREPISSLQMRRGSSRSSGAWEPPPLFQVYPQCLKHAQLQASTLSADTILRLSNDKRAGNAREELAQTSNNDGSSKSSASRISERAKSKHRRSQSGSISRADWTEKIFCLVTTGFLLQYDSSGAYDRLPEKILELGTNSVAFVSDAIPGQHWVLQVSQSTDDVGTPAMDSRSLFSKLAPKSIRDKRSTHNMLLVLENAKDLNSWLAVVRQEIQALGGKKHLSETEKLEMERIEIHAKNDEKNDVLATHGQRVLVRKSSKRLSMSSEPANMYSDVFSNMGGRTHAFDDAGRSASPSRYQSAVSPMLVSQSCSKNVMQRGSLQLDRLGEGSKRLSYASSGYRTFAPSRTSSTRSSSTALTSTNSTIWQDEESIRFMRPNERAIWERRQSMQALPTPTFDIHPPAKGLRPQSTIGFLERGDISSFVEAAPLPPSGSIPRSPRRTWTEPAAQRGPVLSRSPGTMSFAGFEPKTSPIDELPPSHQQPVMSRPSMSAANDPFVSVQQRRPRIVEISARPKSAGASTRKSRMNTLDYASRALSPDPTDPSKTVYTIPASMKHRSMLNLSLPSLPPSCPVPPTPSTLQVPRSVFSSSAPSTPQQVTMLLAPHSPLHAPRKPLPALLESSPPPTTQLPCQPERKSSPPVAHPETLSTSFVPAGPLLSSVTVDRLTLPSETQPDKPGTSYAKSISSHDTKQQSHECPPLLPIPPLTPSEGLPSPSPMHSPATPNSFCTTASSDHPTDPPTEVVTTVMTFAQFRRAQRLEAKAQLATSTAVARRRTMLRMSGLPTSPPPKRELPPLPPLAPVGPGTKRATGRPRSAVKSGEKAAKRKSGRFSLQLQGTGAAGGERVMV